MDALFILGILLLGFIFVIVYGGILNLRECPAVTNSAVHCPTERPNAARRRRVLVAAAAAAG